MQKFSEQEIIRRDKRAQMEELGIPAYPAREFEKNCNPLHILKYFSEQSSNSYKDVSMAGRVMGIRLMGNAAFIEIQDEGEKIQIYLSKDSLCPNEDKNLYELLVKKILDIGDIIGVSGFVFKTKVGSIALHAKIFKILSKALKPLPVVKEVVQDGESKFYDSVSDPEFRYRNRHVDLLINKQSRDTLIKRTKLIRSLRNILDHNGYIEVETPILQPIYGGAAAKPFTTHHNSLDITLYLRISPELYLKRLICGGLNGVYEIGKNFRNEGMSRFHNPEFTMLELYVAYKDYKWMMNKTEEILEKLSLDIVGQSKIKVSNNEINFARPWKRYSFYEIINLKTSSVVDNMQIDQLLNICKKFNVQIHPNSSRSKILDEIFGKICEPTLIDPTFITDYPIEMSPLAKKSDINPNLVERFEVICNGKELCNSYSELNDPIDQRKRFEEQLSLAALGDSEAMMLDEDFLSALEYGMPPTAGLGIGIDRLTMLLCDSLSIQDVLFFPQMKNKK